MLRLGDCVYMLVLTPLEATAVPVLSDTIQPAMDAAVKVHLGFSFSVFCFTSTFHFLYFKSLHSTLHKVFHKMLFIPKCHNTVFDTFGLVSHFYI